MSANKIDIEEQTEFLKRKKIIEDTLRSEARRETEKGRFIELFFEFAETYKLDICEKDPKDGTYLHIAVRHGNVDVVAVLLATWAQPIITRKSTGLLYLDSSFFTAQDGNGHTARDLAIIYNQKKIFTIITNFEKMILKPEVYNNQTWKFLADADFELFKKMVVDKNISPNYKPIGLPCLLFALRQCDRDYAKKIKFLITERQGNPNLADTTRPYNNTLLHGLIINENHESALEIFSYLIDPEHRFNPNLPDKNGRTILMLAIATGCNDLVKKILDSKDALGLQINAQDKAGFSALHYATFLRNNQVIAWLRTHGAYTTTLKDKKGRIPEELLETRYDVEMKELMDSLSINILRDKNAKSNILEGSVPIVKKTVLETYIASTKEKKLTPKTAIKLAELLTTEGDQEKFQVLASKQECSRYRADDLCILFKGPEKFSRLSSPSARDELEVVNRTINSFAGISLQEYILSPIRTAFARQLLNAPVGRLTTLLAEQIPLSQVGDTLILFGLDTKRYNAKTQQNEDTPLVGIILSYLSNTKDVVEPSLYVKSQAEMTTAVGHNLFKSPSPVQAPVSAANQQATVAAAGAILPPMTVSDKPKEKRKKKKKK